MFVMIALCALKESGALRNIRDRTALWLQSHQAASTESLQADREDAA
jgi:hypothetical protein